MCNVAQAPQDESPLAQEFVDVAEQRLVDVQGLKFHLEFERPDRREASLGAAQHIELRTLNIDLEHVDRPAPALGPGVERRRRHRCGAPRRVSPQLGMAPHGLLVWCVQRGGLWIDSEVKRRVSA